MKTLGKKRCLSLTPLFGLLPLAMSFQGASPSPAEPLFERRADGSVALFDGRVVPPLPRLLGVRPYQTSWHLIRRGSIGLLTGVGVFLPPARSGRLL
jgi:hypothetical protein